MKTRATWRWRSSPSPQRGTSLKSGRVLWFSGEKGFGVLETEDGGRLMVDHTGIHANGSGGNVNGGRPEFQTLERGASVEYEVRENPRGRAHATEVRAVEDGVVEAK